jgi:hypothetical protein
VSSAALHTREQFSFVMNTTAETAWPLFGAEGERSWAPGWDPSFIWPREPTDREGMVFKISHALGTAIWVNTSLDRMAGRVQYVYVIPEVVLTVISLQLVPAGQKSELHVTYERTALNESARDRVQDLARGDRTAGEEWCAQIDRHLRSKPDHSV